MLSPLIGSSHLRLLLQAAEFMIQPRRLESRATPHPYDEDDDHEEDDDDSGRHDASAKR